MLLTVSTPAEPATGGVSYADRPHRWHLTLADRRHRAGPEPFRRTAALGVDTVPVDPRR